LFLSLFVSTQEPLHREKPESHAVPHWLFTQVAEALGLVGHTFAQAPQLLGSVLVSAQAPLHSM
jgi:hypothetical protein